MIVVDTSVWVACLRSTAHPHTAVLRALLDADDVGLPVPVRVELLSGASATDRPALRRALSSLPVLYPTDATWHLIDAWVERTASRGERFGVGDLLIAAMASEVDGLIWSLDGDFGRLERVGLVRLYEP